MSEDSNRKKIQIWTIVESESEVCVLERQNKTAKGQSYYEQLRRKSMRKQRSKQNSTPRKTRNTKI